MTYNIKKQYKLNKQYIRFCIYIYIYNIIYIHIYILIYYDINYINIIMLENNIISTIYKKLYLIIYIY